MFAYRISFHYFTMGNINIEKVTILYIYPRMLFI